MVAGSAWGIGSYACNINENWKKSWKRNNVEVKIGNHIFGNNEMVESMLKTGMARLYDLSPGSREAHDDEAIFLNGKKIKSTPEERKAYWKMILSRPVKMDREIQPGEEVSNPWRGNRRKKC